MANFRTSIDEDDLTMIKEGLEMVRYETKNPRNPDYDKLKKVNVLSEKLDQMAKDYQIHLNKIKIAKHQAELNENPANNSDD